MVFFETANGGAVFATGSVIWMSSTPEKNYDNDVAIITRKIMERFLDPAPFVEVGPDDVDDVVRIPPNPEYEIMDKR